ncbi:putative periplasmic-binding protein; putative amino-acid periplasmic-binding protein [Bradyrhizobium sp. ORS 278]|uniref:transporter substrate-binding domain-containing protein n=1 Tax=Bradyrhizobium sp. (strain ORS 278) TaxID=114615 RepID=UPI00015084C1|nr:transporter substrate-binding domain-containing protein [Bradyrhizobium sp. ORS 278]CAL79441.1 putative periplasmic-binding protein; putative amino-acid periplasmic-binding protein [Bradyrhizobium sp. ORS 278]
MLKWHWLRNAALVAAAFALFSNSAAAAGLKEEIAPTGKLRVAVAVGPAGGAFWCVKSDSSVSGVPVELGKAMAAQIGVPVEFVEHPNSNAILEGAAQGSWDVTFFPKDAEREAKVSFGPVYDSVDTTFIIRAGMDIPNIAALDHEGTEVAAINDTTVLRGAKAFLKKATVTGFKSYEEVYALLAAGEIDALTLARDQLNIMAKQIPGTKVLNETFKKTDTAVAVPQKHPQSLAFVTKFMTEAKANGLLKKAYGANNLSESTLLTQ